MGEARIPADDTVDLGDIALALVFRSVGYAVLGLIAAAVVFMLIRISGYERSTNAQFWLFSVAVWVVLQAEIFLRLRRLAKASPPIRSSARTIHALELTSAAFLLLFSIARPYLLESDASSYPYLERLFQLLIGVTACFHLLVLATFKKKPSSWDTAALAIAVLAAVFPFLK